MEKLLDAFPTLIWTYMAIISLVTVIFTVYDKAAAKAGNRRIPEKTLLFLGIIGGAAAEYITMKIIRHKTKHKNFMIGLPIMIALHVLLLILYFKVIFP